MHISMTFDVPAEVAGEIADAVQAILDAHHIEACREVVTSADALKKLNDELSAGHSDVVAQLKGLRRDIRNFDAPA